jgi:hypothetical protein
VILGTRGRQKKRSDRGFENPLTVDCGFSDARPLPLASAGYIKKGTVHHEESPAYFASACRKGDARMGTLLRP